YAMEAAAKDHPVYTMLYKVAAPLPPMQVVSNGVRTLMVHSPQDLALAWQQRMDKSRPGAFQVGVNLFLYAAGKADLRNRVSSHVIPEPPPATGGTMRIARLKYDGGNGDPEPFAWERFGRWFGWETG